MSGKAGGFKVTARGTEPRGRDAVVPSDWADFYQETKVPAAVWAGNTLRVSSHAGETPDDVFPDDPEEQLRGAFRNIASTLAEAGVSWSDVVEINSYHVGLRSQADFMLSVAAEFLEAPYPAWTPVGVTELWPPEAVVEISCVAVVGHQAVI
jgi:enamine deaminase RidA (YjgF/YER057c/UK114 family)